ncbi:uncharacterized protein P174DRAFT_3109 [Aspergillus novofumigatus IBT 16806]|uniref:Uncharacterized protein n=1 Tax=Aspergillus novofumigatus (strain IBT 16806) TaxID=1392255 RepID=A0A2I1CKB2_ASPN1|nr:uncharacterized protein P174DRAFT_3109 [Aspergillus novofumigatus IBT 16806]PKX98067.1 hypothetical protein P174DRAFT_3109 [Aspergillus novofumigatus IBT 16806]
MLRYEGLPRDTCDGLLCIQDHFVRPGRSNDSTVAKLLMELFILHNDYYSWEKENDSCQTKENKLPISNAVTLFMKWHSMPIEEAKAAVKTAAVEREQQYLQAKEEFWEQQRSLDASASSKYKEMARHHGARCSRESPLEHFQFPVPRQPEQPTP